MTDFFELLSDSDFDDVSLTFLEIKMRDLDLELITKVQSEEGEQPFQLAKIIFQDVREHEVALGYQTSPPSVDIDHVLLWSHIKSRASLFFKGTPTSIDQFICALYLKHLDLVQSWLPFGKHLSDQKIVDFIKMGYGLFAEGPEPLIQGYAQVMRDFGVKTSVLTSPPKCWRDGRWIEGIDPLQVFICGSSFVVSREITTTKIPSYGQV